MDNNPYKKAARVMFLITWGLLFDLLLFLFNRYESKQQTQFIDSKRETIVLSADSKGHYHIKGKLNGKDVSFLVDTGASDVAIPEPLARELGLTRYYPVSLHTANGQAQGYLTRVNTLEIGTIVLNNVRAVIMPGDGSSRLLLGMNVISGLEMSQKDGQLTIRKR